jgi:hypothetical protein
MASARKDGDWGHVLAAIGLVLAIVLEVLFSGVLPDLTLGPFTRARIVAMLVTALGIVVLIVILNRLGTRLERMERENQGSGGE